MPGDPFEGSVRRDNCSDLLIRVFGFGICSKSKSKRAETDQIRPNQIKGQRKTNTNTGAQYMRGGPTEHFLNLATRPK